MGFNKLLVISYFVEQFVFIIMLDKFNILDEELYELLNKIEVLNIFF